MGPAAAIVSGGAPMPLVGPVRISGTEPGWRWSGCHVLNHQNEPFARRADDGIACPVRVIRLDVRRHFRGRHVGLSHAHLYNSETRVGRHERAQEDMPAEKRPTIDWTTTRRTSRGQMMNGLSRRPTSGGTPFAGLLGTFGTKATRDQKACDPCQHQARPKDSEQPRIPERHRHGPSLPPSLPPPRRPGTRVRSRTEAHQIGHSK